MKSSEKELLARLFIQHGQDLLPHNEVKAKELFNMAIKIAGENSHLFFLLGKAYLSVEPTETLVAAALELLNHALKLSPKDFEVWIAIAETLVLQGSITADCDSYLQAKWFCEKASTLLPEQQPSAQAAFYFLWGKILFLVGRDSEEAADFMAAKEKFHKAEALGCTDSSFFAEWGDLYSDIALLITREEYYYEAIRCYRRSLQEGNDTADCWFSLGLCYYYLYIPEDSADLKNRDEYFDSAVLCFDNSFKAGSTHNLLWCKWGHLLYEKGKREGLTDLLEECIEKFERASREDPSNFTILFYWAGAEMLLGTVLERIDLLRDAERRFLMCLELQAEKEEVWCLLGNCSYEIGRYFGSTAHYHEAINRFQAGLAINKSSFALWHGMGLVQSSIGETTNDLSMLQKASQCYENSIECGGGLVLQCWNDWGINLMKVAEITHDQDVIEAAIEKFECAIELERSWDPDSESDAELMYNYGCALDSLGEFSGEASCYEKAIQLLTKVVQADPSHLHARYNLAVALAHLGELVIDVECFTRAIDQFEQLIQLDPEDEMAWMEYGAALLTLAMLVHDPIVPQKSEHYFQEAEAKLMHAISLGYVQAYYPLACLYALQNHYDIAMFYMHKAKSCNVLPTVEDMMHDEWLDTLRATEEFQEFIGSLWTPEA